MMIMKLLWGRRMDRAVVGRRSEGMDDAKAKAKVVAVARRRPEENKDQMKIVVEECSTGWHAASIKNNGGNGQ